MTFNRRSRSTDEEEDEHREEESPEVDKDLANLVCALETVGDVASCEQDIPRTFLALIENPSFVPCQAQFFWTFFQTPKSHFCPQKRYPHFLSVRSIAARTQ
jgi:hypothetical protein